MTRLILVSFLALAAAAADACAHGGSFRGPNGGVPPGLRDPADPEPPPPPPSDPGDPGDTNTPTPGPGEVPGHTTPGGDGAAPSPSPRPQPSQGDGRRPSKTRRLTYDSWRFWWGYNNDDILNLKAHVHREGFTRASPLHFGQADDARRDVLQPTRRAVRTSVVPALLRTIRRPHEHEDVHGGALVALGKVGGLDHVPLFEDAIRNRYRTPRGARIDFGLQARESAVLALGLLPDIAAEDKRIVRDICLRAVADGSLRTRERTWAAVCLGLQRDREAVPRLLALLEEDYADDNVPAGILAGLGLIGDPKARATLERILLTGRVGRREASDRVRAFAGYGLAKLGDPKALPAVLDALRARSFGRLVKRSCAIAAGPLGAAADPDAKEDAVRALLSYTRSGGDTTARNFALIALSRIGTERALRGLLRVAADGRYAERPFAALGLGTAVFYRDRAAREGRAERLDPDLRERIVARLAELGDRLKDTDTRAAFLLARGLVKDESAVATLVSIATSRKDPVLRGFACVALGLVGKGTREVKDALLLVLRERKSVDLRRDAATGLGLLHDGDVLDVLLEELRKAKSFAVQGQIVTAIGTIGDQRAIPPLVRLLEDMSQPALTRAMAAVGLGMIGDLRPVPALARLSKDYNFRASVGDLDELLFIL